MVGLQTPGEIIHGNFGQMPFMFDFEGMLTVRIYLTVCTMLITIILFINWWLYVCTFQSQKFEFEVGVPVYAVTTIKRLICSRVRYSLFHIY